MIRAISIPVIVMAVLTFTIGLFYLYLYARRRQKDELAFSLLCFSTVLYDVFSAGLYSVMTIERGVFWQRHQFFAMSAMAVAAVWFVIYYNDPKESRVVIRRLALAFSAGMGLFSVIIMQYNGKYSLSAANPAIKEFDFLGRSVVYYEADPGVLYLVHYALIMSAYLAIMAFIIRRYRQGFIHLKPLLVAFSFFFLAVVNDILVGAGVYFFIYLVEYAFLAIIISMSYILLSRFIFYYDRVSNMNALLEEKVATRTDELHHALDEMERMNESLTRSNRLLEETQALVKRDMVMAGNVQKQIMPRHIPEFDGWEIASQYDSMTGVSGDFFDVYTNTKRLCGVSLFDVSGHGVSSGLITLLAKSMIYRLFRLHQAEGLKVIMEEFNRELKREIGSVDHFLSGVMLLMGPDVQGEQWVDYVNAGHPDIFIKRGEGGPVMPLRPETGSMSGLLLGLEGIDGEFEVCRFTAGPGDVILIFSDGLKESINGVSGEFGLDRIKKSLENAHGSAAEILSSIISDFYSFLGNRPVSDDMTVLVLKRIHSAH